MRTTLISLLTPLGLSLLVGCGAQATLSIPVSSTVIASGFNAPQGVYATDDGNVLVTDDGTGGTATFTGPTLSGGTGTGTYGATGRLVKVTPDGHQSVVASLLSVSPPSIGPTGGGKIAVIGNNVYVADAMWNAAYSISRIPKASSVLRVDGNDTTEVANLFAFEAANNPDGVPAEKGGIDSHTYGLTAGPDGALYVADAGGNDLLKVDPATGKVSLVASLAGRTAGTGAQSVPTSVAFGKDGAIYVSLLSGAPFPKGASRIVKIANGDTVDFATGLTMLTHVTLGPDGNLYAVSFATADLQANPPYAVNSGSIVRIGQDGTWSTVVSGVNYPTAIAFNAAGDAYVTVNAFGTPGSGQLVKYAKLTHYAAK